MTWRDRVGPWLRPLLGWRTRWQLAQYLRHAECPRLHMGCGPHRLPGWLNADLHLFRPGVVSLDAARPLPLSDGSLHFIFCEHFLTELNRAQGLAFLRECHRLLRPGGTLRLSQLGLEFLLELGDDDPYVHWTERVFLGSRTGLRAVVLHHHFRERRFLYDRSALQAALREAGFTALEEAALGQSRHPMLRDLERHGLSIPPEFNRRETLVLEATR